MRMRAYALASIGLAAAVTLTACGGGSTSSGGGTTGPQKSGGTLRVSGGTAPDSLDPGFGYTTQALEGDNMVYTPLLTYPAKEGTAGAQLIPGLAKALPTVSQDGLTYKLQLRSGLKYSDGTAVKASDFKFAVQRSIKIQWGGSSFFSNYIKGGTDFAAGKADSISGITTNDSTGDITIQLATAYGAFANVLAFVAGAPLPSSTAVKVLSNTPPVGIGPYKFGKIVPGSSYTLVKNPTFAANKLSGIPTGYVDQVVYTANSNDNTRAQQVINNQTDIYDPADSIPAAQLQAARTTAANEGRYQSITQATSYYYFFNTRVAPFNNQAARVAVNMAMDRTALARVSAGSLKPGCHFLPPTIVGHVDGPCSFGDPSKSPSAATVAKAKAMIKNAGLAGTKVTVWSETRSPRQEFCEYLNGLLNTLGFKSSLKVTADAVYFQTIGNRKQNAQTGFADWSQDFPNPADFYLLLSKAGIQETNNENFGNVDDPAIQSALDKLLPIPTTQLNSYQGQWAAVDKLVESKGYVGTYGYAQAPKLMSNRVDFGKAVLNPVTYIDFNTVSLKS